MDIDSDEERDRDAYEDEFGVGPSSSTKRNIATPGSFVTSSKEFMRGHGTFVEEEDVMSTVAGTIERVNKLVSVRPVRQR